jgi:NADPH:quinone reductase-like Zn-dependent oxidoreductase
MKGIRIRRFGGPECLEIVDLPEPTPGPGELRIAVEAAGVNFADVLCRLGVYAAAPPPPFVPGIEFAGVVLERGEGVKRPVEGERVFGFCRFGGYAEQVVVRAEHALPMPDGVGFEEAASFPVRYLTAWHGLERLARVESEERVLVRSAAGGVGEAALELLRLRGARVIATVGAEWKRGRVAAISPEARIVLDRKEELCRAIEEEGGAVDVVFDGAGGALFPVGWSRLAPGGRYILYGASSAVGPGALSKLAAAWRLRRMLAVAPLAMISTNRTLAAFNLIFLTDRGDRLRRDADQLLALWREGRIAPRAERVVPLEQAAKVHRELQERRTVGKIVLRVARNVE